MDITSLVLAADDTATAVNPWLTLVLGAALTLAAQFVLERFRRDRDDQKEDRAWRRTWHTELVDLVADSKNAAADLKQVLEHGITASNADVYASAQTYFDGDAGLRRRLQRVSVGHPDGHVRQAAEEISGALLALIAMGFTVELYVRARPDARREDRLDSADREALDAEAKRSIDELISCIDGPEIQREPLQESRSFALFTRINAKAIVKQRADAGVARQPDEDGVPG